MTLTYHTYLEHVLELYSEEKYQEALDYLEAHRESVNGIQAQIDNFEYCIAARMGDTDQAMAIFEKAIQEKGYWYQTEQLESDSDLDSIRSNVKFMGLLEMNRRREHEFLGLGKPMIHVREGSHEHGYIVLHGNHENARVAKGMWDSSVVSGALTLFFQSGQPDFHDAYHWNDRQKSNDDIMELTECLRDKYQDVKSWTLVGFSMGASVVLDIALTKLLQIDKILLFGPWTPHLEDQKQGFESLKDSGRVCIFIGEKDADCMDEATRLKETLEKSGVKTNYTVMAKTGHGFPLDLKDCIDACK